MKPTIHVCVICKQPVGESDGIKAKSSEKWVHRDCLDLQQERVREERRRRAQLKARMVLESLPKARSQDDASVLAVAPERLRNRHAGWSRESNLSLLVVGLSASCKTLTLAAKIRAELAEAIANYAAGADAELDWISGVFFTSAFALCEATRQYPLGHGECPEITKVRRGTLVLIDDLGNENAGFEKWLLSVIDSRISQNLPTWVTSGFTVDQVTERYGQALVRRLCERGSGSLVDLFRADVRKLEAVR